MAKEVLFGNDARAKMLAIARKHHRLYLCRGIEHFEGLLQLFPACGIQRIHFVVLVKGQMRHTLRNR